jgi:hypothetical protein
VRRATVLLACAALLVAGCGSDGADAAADATPSAPPAPATTCAAVAVQVVDTLQRYVDGFADVTPEALAARAGTADTDLREATTDLRARASELGCAPADLAELVRAELPRLTGGASVQDAIVATFRADPLGTVDPADPRPVEVTVTTAEELVSAVSLAGTGSTIRVASGTVELTAPLVARRGVSIIGTGTGTTTIRSTAPGAAVLVATDGDLTLSDLTLVHDGPGASVLVVTGGGYVLERLAVTGGRVDADGGGGFGVVLAPQPTPLRSAGTKQEVRDLVVSDNQGGGLLAAGAAQPRVSGVQVSGSSGCGLCWVDEAGGSLSSSTVTGTDVGLRVDGAADPTVADVRVEGTRTGLGLTGQGAPRLDRLTLTGNVVGAQIVGSGRSTLADVVVTGSADVGIRVADRSRAAVLRPGVDGVTPVGIVVSDQAAPRIIGGQLSTTGEVGLLWAGQASGSASDLVVRGPRVGVQLGESASPSVSRLDVAATREAALLAAGSSTGTVLTLVCGPGTGERVGLVDTTTVSIVDSPTCTVVDQRG